MRSLWVPLLLAPAGVVFVATRTAVDPIASAERLDVVSHLPAAIELPTAAIGITTPEHHVTIRVHSRRPAHHRLVKRAKRIAPKPRPVYVVPKPAVAHVVTAKPAPHAAHTTKPKTKITPKQPEPAPTPPPTPTTPEPTPPVAPPEPPPQPTPTPVIPPSPAPAPAEPAPQSGGGDGDDQGDDNSGDTRPGNGWGDRNHEHTGPPGHDGNHSGHGHD